MKKTKKCIKFLLRVVTIFLIAIVVILFASSIRDEWKSRKVSESIIKYPVSMAQEMISEIQESKLSVTYTSLSVPNINSSFKTWMGYQVWEENSPNSAQYKFFKKWGWVDDQGFARCSAERDLGIEDDYYMVALGSYYGTTLGSKYKITLDTGKVFYAILGEFKANIHTNSTNQYSLDNNDIVEFVIDEITLNRTVMSAGSANVYMPLNGNVAKIERINFN